MKDKTLTLKDCLEVEHGLIGRLFSPEIGFGDKDQYRAYRVLEVTGDTMNVEAYILGGSKTAVNSVPVQERYTDPVMPSEDQLEWYRIAGKTGGGSIF